MDITAVILSTAIVFGLNPFDNSVYQKEVYKPIAMPVHQVKWAGINKLNKLTTLKLSDELNNLKDKDNLLEDGRKKITIKFPIEKSEPISVDELEAFFNLKKQNIKDISVIGYASPDGPRPKMQETLARQRAEKIVNLLRNKGIKVEDVISIVCHKGIEPSKCWRADVYVEIEEKKGE